MAFFNIIKRFRGKSLNERFFLVIGGVMVVVYTIIGLMFIFHEPMSLIIEQESFRKVAGVCIILYAVLRFSKLRNIYLE